MIKTDPETGIIYRQWQATDPQAVFLLVHGLGAHSGRWSALANFFAGNNFSSYALELKGFGVTSGLKGHIDSFNIYFQEIRSLRKIIEKENPGKKIFLAGESFGGLIAFLFCLKIQQIFNGLVLVAPAFSVKMQVPFGDYLRVFLHLFINPRKLFRIRFTGAMCTRDTDYQNQLDTDPLESRQVSARFMANYFLAETAARKSRDRWVMPVLFLVAGEDKVVNPDVTKRIFRWMDARDKEMIKYPEMYHALSIESGRERVFADILNWIKKRI